MPVDFPNLWFFIRWNYSIIVVTGQLLCRAVYFAGSREKCIVGGWLFCTVYSIQKGEWGHPRGNVYAL